QPRERRHHRARAPPNTMEMAPNSGRTRTSSLKPGVLAMGADSNRAAPLSTMRRAISQPDEIEGRAGDRATPGTRGASLGTWRPREQPSKPQLTRQSGPAVNPNVRLLVGPSGKDRYFARHVEAEVREHFRKPPMNSSWRKLA